MAPAGRTAGETRRRGETAADTMPTKPASLPSFDEPAGMLEKVKVPGLDIAATVVEARRRDFEAPAEASRKSFEGLRALLAERRNEMLKEALQRWQESARAAGGGHRALSQGVEQARQRVQKAVENFRELAETEAQSRRDAWKGLQDRFERGTSHLRDLMQPKSKQAAT